MDQFYQNVTKKNMPPISALCNAQRWLKDATNLRLRDAVAVRGNSVEQEYYIKMEKKFKRKENECPYAHPYYWAAFTIIGM